MAECFPRAIQITILEYLFSHKRAIVGRVTISKRFMIANTNNVHKFNRIDFLIILQYNINNARVIRRAIFIMIYIITYIEVNFYFLFNKFKKKKK